MWIVEGLEGGRRVEALKIGTYQYHNRYHTIIPYHKDINVAQKK